MHRSVTFETGSVLRKKHYSFTIKVNDVLGEQQFDAVTTPITWHSTAFVVTWRLIRREVPIGVDVEIEPFGLVNPYSLRSPKRETGAQGGGAYVEFELPNNAILRPGIGPRNTARIPTDQPLALASLRPRFVKIRFWQIWKWWNR